MTRLLNVSSAAGGGGGGGAGGPGDHGGGFLVQLNAEHGLYAAVADAVVQVGNTGGRTRGLPVIQ